MIRIRRIYSSVSPADRDAVRQVQEILRSVFPDVSERADDIPGQLDNAAAHGYRTILLVAVRTRGVVNGFALVNHFSDIRCSFLDFLATAPGVRSGGIGGAVYEAVRECVTALGSRGLYLEAAPDEPAVVSDPIELAENRRRLGFYERYGVYPVVGTAYETPIDDQPGPYLLYDSLGRRAPPGRSACREAVRRILRAKYARFLDAGYVELVTSSIVDEPVRLRQPRYVAREAASQPAVGRLEKPFALAYAESHHIHHVHDRGYVERPARIDAIRAELLGTAWFEEIPTRRVARAYEQAERAVREVHDPDFVAYLKAVCEKLSPSRPVYPYVFPVRRPDRKPKDALYRAGYYCIDTFTPLDRNAYTAARAAVGVVLSAVEELLSGRHVAYALCRPPGHHAERRVFGGFCYFNNAAVAARRLSSRGAVAVLDLDYHHGNGAQEVFYRSADVLTISLHGHPNRTYPYFSGYADERGEGPGEGRNRNYPLSEHCGPAVYLSALDKALAVVHDFRPAYLVVPLGFDTMKGDPTGSFDLGAGDMERIGRRVGSVGVPVLVVQEGGYSLPNLRAGSRAFFRGLASALVGP